MRHFTPPPGNVQVVPAGSGVGVVLSLYLHPLSQEYWLNFAKMGEPCCFR